MTKETLTEEQRRKIRSIIEDLFYDQITFDWSKTKEGASYWIGVSDALERIANSIPEGEKEIELNGRKYRLVEE